MNARWAFAIAWVAFVLFVSLVPGAGLVAAGVSGLDKLIHFTIYAIMAFSISGALRRPCLLCWVAVTAVCGLLGAALEVAQHFVPGRVASAADAVANVLGAASAGAVYVRVGRSCPRGGGA